jgi:sirohydrochlorin cobaltochelatase
VTDSRLVIFAHGSQDSRWRLPFEELAANLTERHGTDKVRLAYMEFVHPTLLDIVREAAQDGKLHLRVLPLFLAAGAHVAEDIPQQIADAQGAFPQVKIELLKPIGEHPRVKELFRDIACDYVRD